MNSGSAVANRPDRGGRSQGELRAVSCERFAFSGDRFGIEQKVHRPRVNRAEERIRRIVQDAREVFARYQRQPQILVHRNPGTMERAAV